MKSTAVRGLNVRTMFSPFYDTARRFLGISPATVDDYLHAGAVAAFDGRVVTLTKPGGQVHTATARGWHRSKAAAWVNEFNGRAAA